MERVINQRSGTKKMFAKVDKIGIVAKDSFTC
jgi:hypothetical protein